MTKKTYTVLVHASLRCTVEIEASSAKQALKRVNEAYADGYISLDLDIADNEISYGMRADDALINSEIVGEE